MTDLAKRIAALSPEKRALLMARIGKKREAGPLKETIPKRKDTNSFPLSFAQQRMWFLNQLEPESPFYNIAAAVRLTGTLQVKALEQSLNEVLRRHEVLRATFQTVKGRPVQVIAPELTLSLTLVDLQSFAETKREVAARRLATQEAQRPFDLSCGPLLRVSLLRLSVAEHILLLTIHHIVSDGWAIGVLIREVAAAYRAFSTGGSSPLPELPIQYADYAEWQREHLQGEVLESQVSYWKRQLDSSPPLLELPTNRPRPSVQTYRGAHHSFQLPAGLEQELSALSKREGVTLFMTLLAAFQTLLHRYANQDEISIGVPFANRHRIELESLIGLVANTLVLRTDLSGEPSFRELLKRAREVTLGAYAHQDLPFERLIEELQLERELSRTPLFQAMFALQRDQVQNLEIPGLKLSLLETESGTAKFDLMLVMEEASSGLRGMLEYNSDLFDETTIIRLADHLQMLLESIVTNPDQQISRLPLLTEAERRQLLVDWNDTQTDDTFNQCLHHLFEAQVKRAPDACAVVFGEERLTYQELNARANQLAHHLKSLGVGPEVLVGICAERSLEMVVSLLGILKAGGAYVPLDPAYPPERLAFMLEDSRAPVLLTQQRLIEKLFPERHSQSSILAAQCQVVCFDSDQEKIARESADNPVSQVAPEHLAYVIYTSGSTGRPKGVAIEHRSTVAFIAWAKAVFLAEEIAGVLAATSICFDLSVFELFFTLSCGGKVILAENALQLPELPEANEVTLINTVPSALAELVLMGGLPPSVQVVNLAGEPLPLALAQQVYHESQVRKVYNLYGPSEDTTYSTFTLLPDDAGSVTIGRPIANTQVYLLDQRRQPVPIGVPGELHLGGAGLARGYLNRPELTAEKFIANPFSDRPGARLYKTGDLARYLPDGRLEFLGRLDQQVKIRGFRIELGEIEAVLGQHPALQKAIVQAREDDPGKRRLVAYIVAAEEPAPSVSELRKFLQERLPEYMVPSAFVTLAALPLTPNGKIDRRALPAPGQMRPELEKPFLAPRTPIERLLAKMWQEVLGIEKVGIDDNFFELGGDSIQAAVLTNRLQEELSTALPVKSIFLAPKIAQLVDYINEHHPQAAQKWTDLHPIPRDADLPLSFAQQRLWVIDQLEPGSPVYNLPAAVRLTGRLDVAALKQSLNEILRRHEILRTTFATIDGRPVQIIAPELVIDLPEVDLSGEPDREAKAEELATEEAQRPFNLTCGPLIRAHLLRLDEQEHVALLVIHHIISDGWSTAVLIQEIAALYAAFSTGQPSPLPELPIQYADYAHWQREWLQGEVLEKQLAYWKQQLSGSLPVLELPTDRPRPAIQTARGAMLPFVLPEKLTEGLKALSRREGVTLFMTLLAAFQTLLHRYSGQEEISVGTPIANRNRAEIECLIGLFANTLVVRTDFADAPSFLELMKRVRQTAMEAYAHQDVPFEMLVDELCRERNQSYSPLFQVAFAFQNVPTKSLTLPGLTITPLEVSSGTAKFDLTVLMAEGPEGLSGVLEYRTDLFERTTIARMIAHFQTLLESLLVDPNQAIATLPLLSAAEGQQLLVEWNQTQTAYPVNATLPELFAAQAAQRPDAVAIVCEQAQLSYRELNHRANQLAHHLRRRGVGAETLVGLCLERSAEMVIGLLGVLKAGGAYLPLDASYPKERLAFMLADAKAPVVLTQARWLDRLPVEQAETLCLDADWELIEQESGENPASSISADQLAYVIYTSGSTGQPKGVSIIHRSVVRLVKETNYAQLSAAEVFLQLAPISFDASTFELWGSLLNGARLVLLPPQMPSLEELGEALVRYQVTTLWLTSGLFHQMVEAQLENLCQVTQLLAGGDVLSAAQVRKYLAGRGRGLLINGYGPTEGTTFTCCHAMEAGSEFGSSAPIGRPISNTQVYLLDEQLNPVPIGVWGELYIGGDGLARGYLNRPELTAEKFRPDPFSAAPGARLYRSGDLARYRSDGHLEFFGRLDHQAKIRGFRIELGEIETVLGQHPAVQGVVVLARAEGPGEKRLVAYVVLAPGQAPSVSELRSWLTEKLPEYMAPSAFVMLDALPLTPNGKVDRQALPAPEGERPSLDAAFIAPRTATEEMLAGIWSQVLGVKQVGVNDNFFELGGDSILSIQVIAKANQAGLRLTPRQLFQFPTVAGLAAVAGTTPAIQAEQGIVEGPLPLTPIQRWFFEQRPPEPHHWNQAMLLEVRQPLDRFLLAAAVERLLQHHDALRLRFELGPEGWQQVNAGIDSTGSGSDLAPLAWLDLSALPAAQQRQALEAQATKLQASLSLSAGPLLRVAYFDLGTTAAGRLLLVIHHLAVDGVSWRILMEDLLRVYEQLSRGEAARLPAKTTSFRHWAQQLAEYAQAEEVREEVHYWLSVTRRGIAKLPVDFPDGANTEASMRSVRASLDAEETRALLQDVPAAYGTEINDALLAALAQVLAWWTGSEILLVDLEGHGREDIFEEIDLSRTVGWFTAIYPVRLELRGDDRPGEMLKTVKEQLRRVPNRGIGYGLLRYLSDEVEIRKQLRAQPRAEVVFNYLGQFDQTLEASARLRPAPEEQGPERSPRGRRTHLLEISSSILVGQMQMEWRYSDNLHQRGTIEALAQQFIWVLRALIAHCQSAEAGGYTPSDFVDVNLNQEEIEALINEVG